MTPHNGIQFSLIMTFDLFSLTYTKGNGPEKVNHPFKVN